MRSPILSSWWRGAHAVGRCAGLAALAIGVASALWHQCDDRVHDHDYSIWFGLIPLLLSALGALALVAPRPSLLATYAGLGLGAVSAALVGFHGYHVLLANPDASCGCLGVQGALSHAAMLALCSGLLAVSARAESARLGPMERRRVVGTALVAVIAVLVGGVFARRLERHASGRPDRTPTASSEHRATETPSALLQSAAPELQSLPESPPSPVSQAPAAWRLVLQVRAPESAAGVQGTARGLSLPSGEVTAEANLQLLSGENEIVMTPRAGERESERPSIVVLDAPGFALVAGPVRWEEPIGKCRVELGAGETLQGRVVDGGGRPAPGVRVLASEPDPHRPTAVPIGGESRARSLVLRGRRVALAISDSEGNVTFEGWGEPSARLDTLDVAWFPIDWVGANENWHLSSSEAPVRPIYGRRFTLVVGRVLLARLRVFVTGQGEDMIDCVRDGLPATVSVLTGSPPQLRGGPLPIGRRAEPMVGQEPAYAIATWLSPDSMVSPLELPAIDVDVEVPGTTSQTARVPWQWADDARGAAEIVLRAEQGLGRLEVDLQGVPRELAGAQIAVELAREGPTDKPPMHVRGRVSTQGRIVLPMQIPAGGYALTSELWDGAVAADLLADRTNIVTLRCRPLTGLVLDIRDSVEHTAIHQYGVVARGARLPARPFLPSDGVESWQSGVALVGTTGGPARTRWLVHTTPEIRIVAGASGYEPQTIMIALEPGRVLNATIELKRRKPDGLPEAQSNR